MLFRRNDRDGQPPMEGVRHGSSCGRTVRFEIATSAAFRSVVRLRARTLSPSTLYTQSLESSR